MSFGSNVRVSILGFLTVGSRVLFILSVSVLEYSVGSGVKSVVDVLPAFSVSWFVMVQSCIC